MKYFRKASLHTEWLSMMDISGPFLAISVLERVFPQGLEVVETPRRQRLRSVYDEWRDAVDENDPQLIDLHREWFRFVLREILEYDDSVLIPNVGEKVYVQSSEDHGGFFSPDFFVKGSGDGKPRLFISLQSTGTDLEKVKPGDGWSASIVERMISLCRANDVRLGLLTDGERWMLVNAPVGATSGHASWYSRLWFQEPVTLKAFQSLLGIRRFYGKPEETLEPLLEESLEYQEEVTNTLGEQVRRAVEVLVQSLDKADQDRNRELLRDVAPAELYEAGLTVMMRLVFVLCAEERGLLLSGDSVYDQCYAVSTLRNRLAEESERLGPEVLERRHDAWSRLLAVFRAIYGGIDQETLRMPALGGSLFDPDRFPFLEGRAKGSGWRDTTAIPLPIDNRTVLLLLDALQVLEQKGGALLLSYKALDVEQIGHVYEGLLEYTVVRLPKVTLGLEGSQKAKNPNVALDDIEITRRKGESELASLVQEVTQRSSSAIEKDLKKEVDDTTFGKVIAACGGDLSLSERIRPFAHLLRQDAWGDLIVYRKDAFSVTLGADRRETGTHYTPKSLTETIVEKALEPVVYIGPAEGKPCVEWKLRTPPELLDLKICDPAMGSGAFLVQVCRWLSERLVESWGIVEASGKYVTVDGDVRDDLGAFEPLPKPLDDRLLIARRLIAEKCIYGVDINPLAVELAKLSIWLVTMAKGRPFGFLDHNFRSGDSLLGIHRLDQLTKLSMDPDNQKQIRVFGKNIEAAVVEAIEIRKKLREIPIRDILDVEKMKRLNLEARKKIEAIEIVADAMIGEIFRTSGNDKTLETALDELSTYVGAYFSGKTEIGKYLTDRAKKSLLIDISVGKLPRKPFHWPLEFPELIERGGFDIIIGNPPFLGGRRIRRSLGLIYLRWLTEILIPFSSGNADLCAFFYRRIFILIRKQGCVGLMATNTISQGDTRSVGLEWLCQNGASIFRAISNYKWPGSANLTAAIVWFRKGEWNGLFNLDGADVKKVDSSLNEPGAIQGIPRQLLSNAKKSFQGSIVLGGGFVISPAQAKSLIDNSARNADILFPYLRGEDFTSQPDQCPTTWVINFFDWPLNHTTAPKGYKGPVATDYPDCLKIVEKLVKPERVRLKPNSEFVLRKPLPQKWWIYSDKRPALYKALSNLKRVIFHSFTGKYVIFAFVPVGYVYAGPHNVFILDKDSDFAVLQSSFHIAWAWRHCSTMEKDLRYANGDLFETFPFPVSRNSLEEIGKKYHVYRQTINELRSQGLTSTYNLFNDPQEKGKDILMLRALHIELDKAVAVAYGWTDLDLDHGFYQTKQGIRYTISDSATKEVLQRLLKLNHEQYAEEVRQGLHDEQNLKSVSTKSHGKQVAESSDQLKMFDELS